MSNVKIFHEAPVSIITDIAELTDGDYCLVHLMEKNEKYRKYFLEARNIYNREVLLDCSIFELGAAFDSAKYIDWFKQIKPNSFIIPDVLEDSKQTIENFKTFTKAWKSEIDEVSPVKIGAIQGKTWQEIVNCYKFMKDNADMIAISFDFSYYQVTGEGNTPEEKQGSGRRRLVEQLISAGIWDKYKPVHFLGTSTPQSLKWIKEVSTQVSVDTSNPVLHGLKGIKYNSTFGLNFKIKDKMADLMDVKVTEDQWYDIRYNINQFKKIVNG